MIQGRTARSAPFVLAERLMPLADLEDRARGGDVAAQVALAERLDASGRHEEAINWLSRAARAGDAGALTQLGLRLLEGRDAPALPAQGAGLLSDAAARGSAEAATMISVLAGGGFHGPQSWSVALDYLQRAAELGGGSARDQLRLLAGEAGPPDASRGPKPPESEWRRLRGELELESWLRPPDPDVIRQTPAVVAFPGFAPPEVCDWIVEKARPGLQRALVHDPATGRTIMGSTRTNRVSDFQLRDTTLLFLLLQARIAAAARVPAAALEAFAVLHYGVGEQASEHFDYLDPQVPSYAEAIARHGQRVATCLLYLNDGYQGGETEFPALGLRHRGRKGDALVFASVDASGAPDPRSLHAGRPPTSGEKWVLSQFIRDKVMAPGAA
jgi:hypothetical protein